MEALTLTVKGLRLAAQATGDVTGPPVLALHGWLDNSETFVRLAGELGEWSWVCLDFPGHGHSAHRPPGVLYHICDYVSDALGALDALGWERATLIAHSMGAGVAALVAAVAPERVERLVLIEGFGPMSADPSKATGSLRSAALGQLASPAAEQPRFNDVAQAVAARRFATPKVDRHALEAIVRRNLRAVGPGFDWRTDARLRLPSPQPFMEAAILQMLGDIRAPVLLVEATGGYLHDRGWLTNRLARVPHARHIVVPGDHHLHTGAAATKIAVAVRNFMTTPFAGDGPQ